MQYYLLLGVKRTKNFNSLLVVPQSREHLEKLTLISSYYIIINKIHIEKYYLEIHNRNTTFQCHGEKWQRSYDPEPTNTENRFVLSRMQIWPYKFNNSCYHCQPFSKIYLALKQQDYWWKLINLCCIFQMVFFLLPLSFGWWNSYVTHL